MEMFDFCSKFIQNFDFENQENISSRWKSWVEQLERLFIVTNIKEDDRKVATLFLIGGTHLDKMYKFLQRKEAEEPKKTTLLVQSNDCSSEYDTAVACLTKYFNIKKDSYNIGQFKFRQTKQNNDESLEQYLGRLIKLGLDCDLHNLDEEIKSQLYSFSNSHDLKVELASRQKMSMSELQRLVFAHDACVVMKEARRGEEHNSSRQQQSSENNNR